MPTFRTRTHVPLLHSSTCIRLKHPFSMEQFRNRHSGLQNDWLLHVCHIVGSIGNYKTFVLLTQLGHMRSKCRNLSEGSPNLHAYTYFEVHTPQLGSRRYRVSHTPNSPTAYCSTITKQTVIVAEEYVYIYIYIYIHIFI